MQYNYLRRTLLTTLVSLLTLPPSLCRYHPRYFDGRLRPRVPTRCRSLPPPRVIRSCSPRPSFIRRSIYLPKSSSTRPCASGATAGLPIPSTVVVKPGHSTLRRLMTSTSAPSPSATVNSDESGGAILNTAGQLFLDGMRITDSNAGGTGVGNGGGAVASGGRLLVAASQFMNNSATGEAGSGGAILSTGGGFAVVGTTFTGNTSTRAGGAIEISGDASGSTAYPCNHDGQHHRRCPGQRRWRTHHRRFLPPGQSAVPTVTTTRPVKAAPCGTEPAR